MNKKYNDVLIVGVNANKQDAYMACRRGTVVRAAHGVYFPSGISSDKLFQKFGMRLAKYFFPQAALTHASAWHKKPIQNTVFVGGDYPYKKHMVMGDSAFRILQSMVMPRMDNEALYTVHQFLDPLGSFSMHCATPELIAIQQMDATKQNMDKHLDNDDWARLLGFLMHKHKNRVALLSALEQVAVAANKINEFERLLKQFFLRRIMRQGSAVRERHVAR